MNRPQIESGVLIDYELKLHGIPLKWQSAIDRWEPHALFTDRQVRGPYAWWHHTHTFREKDGGTLIGDRVEYRVPGGWLGNLVAGAYVRRDLQRIFRFRQESIERNLKR